MHMSSHAAFWLIISAFAVQSAEPLQTPEGDVPAGNAATNSSPRGAVSIKADGGFEYTGESGRVIYRKNVVVLDPMDNPRTVIRCDWLTTLRTPDGRTVTEITAETNVVIHMIDAKGTNILRGDRAVYTTADDTVTIHGNPPMAESSQSILIGEKFMIYERRTGRFTSPGRIEQMFRQSALIPLIGTNTAAEPPPKPSSLLKGGKP